MKGVTDDRGQPLHLRRIEAPDGRFWTVHHHAGLWSSTIEASTDALPNEHYRWRIRGWGKGRSTALGVARALRRGDDPTPAGATLLSHTVAAPSVPPTGNVHLV